jgi:transposase
VTAGQRNDAAWLERVLDEIHVPRLGRGRPRKRPFRLRVDRAYSYKKQRQVLRRRGIGGISPEREDAKKHRLAKGSKGGRPPVFDKEAYKGRNVIERCINRLKDFRAVATRYDKRGRDYLAGVLVASIILWL